MEQGSGVADKGELSYLLSAGWDTPVAVLEDYAAEARLSLRFWQRSGDELEGAPGQA